MQPNKSQLDTLEIYLRTLVSTGKAKSLRDRFGRSTEEKADEAIRLFETRSHVRLQDVERLVN